MNDSKLILVLGDQLSTQQPALRAAVPGRDIILMAEVAEEASYVRHNRHKIALLFSAMRHFQHELESLGFRVEYVPFEAGTPSLEDAVSQVLDANDVSEVMICEPGEYRLLEQMKEVWPRTLGTRVTLLEDDRFLASHTDFAEWAQGKKQLRMEFFYRKMRQRYQILMDGSEPAGGKWNYDADNRVGWRNQVEIPDRPDIRPDAMTSEVIEMVLAKFPDNPGDLRQFRLAVTKTDAGRQFDWFVENTLGDFGTYQDALVEEWKDR